MRGSIINIYQFHMPNLDKAFPITSTEKVALKSGPSQTVTYQVTVVPLLFSQCLLCVVIPNNFNSTL